MIQHIIDRIKGKVPAGAKRSSRWPKARKEILIKNPKCAVCGGTKKLEVHHVQPFHLAPEKELDQTNLIVLCESKKGGINCHLGIGHLGNYKSNNPDVRADANFWAVKISQRP